MVASLAMCVLTCVVVANVVTTTGCRPKNKRYALRGQVMKKNAAANVITVKHGEIPGLMPAMTMPYKVHDPSMLQKVEPGDMITAELVVTSDGNDYWLENVRIVDSTGRSR